MNVNRQERLIEIAKTMMPERRTGKNFHVSFILDKNKLLITGVNDYRQLHLSYRFGEFLPQKTSTVKYIAGRHSEIVALNIFIKRFGNNDCSGLTLFNVRIGNDGEPKMAKPCGNCYPIVNSCGFKRIIWT